MLVVIPTAIPVDPFINKLGKAELPGQNSIDLEYDIQFLSHAALEPMNCTADVTKTSCEIWGPFQAQSKALETIKKLTEFGQDQIKIHTTYVGGGFGGRFRLWADDFIEQAVTLSKNLGKPVQDGTYVWRMEFRETVTDERYIKTGHVNVIR